MHIKSLGRDSSEHGLVILDSNVVNPFVVAFLGDKQTNHLFSQNLINVISSSSKRKLVWQIAACESYFQRGMEPKTELIAYCNSLFSQLQTMASPSIQQLLECPRDRKKIIRERERINMQGCTRIYIQHLCIYTAMLKLLTMNRKSSNSWNDYRSWISSIQLDIDNECMVFAQLFLVDQRGFQFERLTHYSGMNKGDRLANCAWNAAWDILLISSLVNAEGHCLLYTQDSGLRDYYKYRSRKFTTKIMQSKCFDRNELINSYPLSAIVKKQEAELGITVHYDARRHFAGGVRMPNYIE